jgi:PAS domain S-box-containing protein
MDATEGTRQEGRVTVTVDRDGIIREWDDGVTDVAGYSADEAVGRNLDVVIPPVLRSLHWHGFDKAIQGSGAAQRSKNSRRTRKI